MLFDSQTIASILFLYSSLASAAIHKRKRAILSTSLYAYGGNVNGFNVFYADGE